MPRTPLVHRVRAGNAPLSGAPAGDGRIRRRDEEARRHHRAEAREQASAASGGTGRAARTCPRTGPWRSSRTCGAVVSSPGRRSGYPGPGSRHRRGSPRRGGSAVASIRSRPSGTCPSRSGCTVTYSAALPGERPRTPQTWPPILIPSPCPVPSNPAAARCLRRARSVSRHPTTVPAVTPATAARGTDVRAAGAVPADVVGTGGVAGRRSGGSDAASPRRADARSSAWCTRAGATPRPGQPPAPASRSGTPGRG